MVGSGDTTPDGGLSEVINLNEVRLRGRRVRAMGDRATRHHGGDRIYTDATVTRLFPKERSKPYGDEVELMEALTTLESVSGHRRNAINSLLHKVGTVNGDSAEYEATIRVAKLMISNPKADLLAIKAAILPF